MGIHDDFINKIVSHPEWDKIKEELEGPLEEPELVWDNNRGLRIYTGSGYQTKKDQDNADLHCKLCWYIGNGPGYCEDAPENIKVYLRRLGVKV